MFHKGARTSGGNLPQGEKKQVETILDEFFTIVSDEVRKRNLRRAVVRSMLPCNLIIALDSQYIYIAAQKSNGMPGTIYLDHRGKAFTKDQIFEAAVWEFGYENPFVIQFPSIILTESSQTRIPILQAIAYTHIESEINRVNKEKSMLQFNPVFGPAAYSVENKFIFTLMPFTEELTKIYNDIIKPTIEGEKLKMVCKRADEIKSNKAIIQDIFKGICEARIVIADLTNLNPNVMYELGIAHTIGKETILIYQRNDEIKFPLDVTHIRRIEYKNDASGGKHLENELIATIGTIIN